MPYQPPRECIQPLDWDSQCWPIIIERRCSSIGYNSLLLNPDLEAKTMQTFQNSEKRSSYISSNRLEGTSVSPVRQVEILHKDILQRKRSAWQNFPSIPSAIATHLVIKVMHIHSKCFLKCSFPTWF